MRSTKLPVIAAAAAMLALAPAGASAAGGHLRPKLRKHTSGAGHCRLSIAVAHNQLTTGESAEVSGRLACSASAGTPPTVTVYGRTPGAGGFQALGTATLAGTAYPYTYSFTTIPVTTDTQLYAGVTGANSESKLVRVGTLVTLTGPSKTPPLETGNAVTFTGTAAEDPNARVFLERQSSLTHEDWRVIQTATHTGPHGEFTFVHKFLAAGEAEIRVAVAPHGQLSAPGYSEALNYDISQRQNPLLELNSSPDPLFFGQSTTLSGVVKGAAKGQTVNLIGHPVDTSHYTILGSTTTGEGGIYSFLPQAPAKSMFYRVTFPGAGSPAARSSRLLFEGVKSVLVPNAPPTAAVAGQELTFEGTVTPAAAKVYLEAENPRGGGFHRVAEGTGATGKYVITRVITGSGVKKFRIKVPGGAANQPTASTPFTITVTPRTH